MTDEGMALLGLIEKQADGDLVREMLAFAAKRIMELEVELRTGAAKGGTFAPRQGGLMTGVFNGPGTLAWRNAGNMQSNGQRPISLFKLAALSREVPDSRRLTQVRGAPV